MCILVSTALVHITSCYSNCIDRLHHRRHTDCSITRWRHYAHLSDIWLLGPQKTAPKWHLDWFSFFQH